MTDFEREVRAFILRAMKKAQGAVTDSWLRSVIQNGFYHVAFTADNLAEHIDGLKRTGLIAGIEDDTLGRMWALTPDGKIKAQQLG